jgi:hypothetical protein
MGRGSAAATGALNGAAAGGMVGGPLAPYTAAAGGIIGGLAGYFGSKQPDGPPSYKGYDLTPEQISAYGPANLNIPGATPYNYTPVHVKYGTKQEQAAAEQKAIGLQVAQANKANEAARFGAASNDINQQITNNEGYGATYANDLERQRTQQFGQSGQSAVGRGMYNSSLLPSLQRGVNSDYAKNMMNLQANLTDRRNALLQNRANLYSNINPGQPLNLFGLGREGANVAANQYGIQQAQQQAQQANNMNLLSNLGSAAVMAYANRQQQPGGVGSSYLPQNSFGGFTNPFSRSHTGSATQPVSPYPTYKPYQPFTAPEYA